MDFRATNEAINEATHRATNRATHSASSHTENGNAIRHDEDRTSVLETLASKAPHELVAPDCRGLNFYQIDQSARDLLALRLREDEHAHIQPHLDRLGEVAGNELDMLASLADRNPPKLHARDRFGRDEDWIEYHPSYREMERIAFEEFGIHAMSRTEGVLGWSARYSPLSKYAFQYLFVQSEFGLMCPISLTDSSAYLIERYGDAAVQKRFLPGMTSTRLSSLLKGSQFMTERTGGSDVGTNRLQAIHDGKNWRLYGDKWFCSAADADVALILARPADGGPGTAGLALFAVPKRLDDGSRNTYRIARLKGKLGTRSMPSGEIIFEGAHAYLVGDASRGLKQMLDQVNLSRLSHGVRAAAMMRRCWNESWVVVNHRHAFGRRLIDLPLQKRQLLKILLPTEQALSCFTYAAQLMDQSDRGDNLSGLLLRILTPLLKLRSCRDNIRVATAAMEIRGGNGYIEDFVNERLVRDAHLGVIWEGTSNINALDAVQRAAGKDGSHHALTQTLLGELSGCASVPASLRESLSAELVSACAFMDDVASDQDMEDQCRSAATDLYNTVTAVLMAIEGATLGTQGKDARRLLLSHQVLVHRVQQARRRGNDAAQDNAIINHLLSTDTVTLEQAHALLS
ncbi:DNA alkylation response protein [Orrella marina]|uniref:DNA alkylation response protein n=1 Tax=Orrella marina TaxID=2163011 RepID=A0A2R4XFH5_9BURK|nr:DNA alkylation response protein [Orrella marina]